MKRIGIITMHKPISYGSALQSYALQKKIEDFGYEVELIDYRYPNELHYTKDGSIKGCIRSVISFVINMLWGFPNIKKRKKFDIFYNKFYKTSAYYPTAESLKENPPIYDLYITGSDQVWNPKFIKQDSSFLLSFVSDDKPKISYASSFATTVIPEGALSMYKENLSRYQAITVRESSGVTLVKELIGRDAKHVCDPTLLLSKEEWESISELSEYKIGEEPYILVFMLCYSFNPYPQARNVIHQIQKTLGIRTIYLDGQKHDLFEPNSKIVKSAGPLDFIKLIKNAQYVITDSFHGTIFSNIFNKPFTAIVKSGNVDSRIVSLLKEIGNEECAVTYDAKQVFLNKMNQEYDEKLRLLSNESSQVLKYLLDKSM